MPPGHWIDGITYLPYLPWHNSSLPNVPRAKFLGSDGLLYFISICKFCCLKNSFGTITSLSELYFRFWRFILLVQMKKEVSMNYGSSTSSCKPWRWVRLDLIFLMRVTYNNSTRNPLAKFSNSSRRTSLKSSQRPCQSAQK